MIPLTDLKELYQKFTILSLALRGVMEIESHSMIQEHELEAVHVFAMELNSEFRELLHAKEEVLR